MGEDRRIRKSKAALKKALLVLMRKKEFHKISVKELCGLAELNRSTFYANYRDTEELLLDVHTDIFMQMREALGEEWTAVYDALPGKRKDALCRIIRYLDGRREVFILLLSNNDGNIFEKNMTDYYGKLYVPQDASWRERYVFLYHSIGSFSLICKWLEEQRPCEPEELAELICSMSESGKENGKKGGAQERQ